MTCTQCGAAIKDAGAFCSHCGTRIQRPERSEPAIRTATEPTRFDLARASTGYEAALRHDPKISGTAIQIVMPLAMIAFAVFFMVGSTSMGAVTDHPLGIMFLVVPGVMIAMAFATIAAGQKFAKAPITRELRVVVDERTNTSGGGNDTSVSTHYYATLQARDGSRVEHETYGGVAGRIAPGDIGVAFLKGGRLVDFLRLET